jgi:hypothetical protein
MKTSELTGAALDWAVAKCEGLKTKFEIEGVVWLLDSRGDISRNFNPSSNWSWSGPIIEREGLTLTHQDVWVAQTDDDLFAYGPTPLIAAMRVYVASKLGDDVDVPEELK